MTLSKDNMDTIDELKETLTQLRLNYEAMRQAHIVERAKYAYALGLMHSVVRKYKGQVDFTVDEKEILDAVNAALNYENQNTEKEKAGKTEVRTERGTGD